MHVRPMRHTLMLYGESLGGTGAANRLEGCGTMHVGPMRRIPCAMRWASYHVGICDVRLEKARGGFDVSMGQCCAGHFGSLKDGDVRSFK
eukprot:1161472-Pelagomonas_calceolata.AAC.4